MNKKFIITAIVLLFAAGASFIIYKKFYSRRTIALPVTKRTSVSKTYKSVSVTASYFTDMESIDTANWKGFQNNEKFFSGSYSNKLDRESEFGITFRKKVNEIPEHEKIREIRISCQVWKNQALKEAGFVYSVSGEKDKVYEYFKEDLHANPNKWLSNEIVIPVNAGSWGSDAVINIYPWNSGKELFYVDDIKIDFLSEVERQQGYSISPQQNFIYDFEPAADVPPSNKLSTEAAHSGKYSMKLAGSDDYSESVVKHFSEIASDTVRFISTSIWLYPKEDNPVVALVVSIEKPDGSSIAWNGKSTEKMALKKNEWHKINFRADLRQTKTSPDDVIKIYVWNKKSITVYADDLEIVYGDIPNPSGFAPMVMMNMTGNPVSQQGKNKPPFPGSTFTAVDFFNPPSVYLSEAGGVKDGELNPENLLLAGSFSANSESDGDLFLADAKKWSLYTWCKEENNFVSTCSFTAPFDAANKISVKGFFNSLQNEDILFIDTAGKNIKSLRFNSSGKNVCSKNTTALKQEIVNVPMPAFDNATFIVSGNFTGDKKDELLFSSPGGHWKIYGMKNGNLVPESEGVISRGKILSMHSIETGSDHRKLLLFSERDNKLDYCTIDFSKGASASIREFKDKSFLDYYSKEGIFYSGNYETSGASSLFYFNPEWRFDLKKVSLTDNGLMIDSQVEFNQNDPSRNPRYYEYTKILQGKFFDDKTDYMLVIMRNCLDPDFDGKHCSEFEEVKDMPAGFAFYVYQSAR
jgi:hypothetical protein